MAVVVALVVAVVVAPAAAVAVAPAAAAKYRPYSAAPLDFSLGKRGASGCALRISR